MRNSMNTLKKLIGLLVLALSLSFSGCEAPLSSANDVAIATKPDWKNGVIQVSLFYTLFNNRGK